MSYKDDLLHVEWLKRRVAILQRDNYKCKVKDCKTPLHKLQVHHFEYFSDLKPWLYPDDMLITLCDNCHLKENGRERLEIYLATTLKMKGFLVSDLVALSCKIDTDNEFTQTLLTVLRNMQNG